VLVLPVLRPHDSIARFTPLPERQITGGRNGGVGRKEHRRREGVTGQSQVGAAPCEVIELGRVMADGTDEDGAYAARMDEWESVETAPRGVG
jgi:hypothetical protein